MAFLAPAGCFSLRRISAVVCAMLGLSLLEASPARAQSDNNPREFRIKAAFLYNFVQFVRWPESAFLNASQPFYIGVLGSDPFGPALDETIRGAAINGHRLAVKRSKEIGPLMDCQMIFVGDSEASRVIGLLTQMDSRPILTVSDLDGFAREGGDIAFYLSADKVRFEVNPQEARRQGLSISSQMLSLGKIVNHENE
jgi:hypothetical protein